MERGSGAYSSITVRRLQMNRISKQSNFYIPGEAIVMHHDSTESYFWRPSVSAHRGPGLRVQVLALTLLLRVYDAKFLVLRPTGPVIHVHL